MMVIIFCCLGVLCDIVRPDDWHDAQEDLFDGFYHQSKTHTAMPSQEILEIAGLAVEDARALAELNDSGYSFDSIAKRIEDTL